MGSIKIKMTTVLCLFFALFLAVMSPVHAEELIIDTDVTTPSNGCSFLGVRGSYVVQAGEAIDRINEIRLEACQEGVKNPDTGEALTMNDYVPIKWSSGLEYYARIRAAESALTRGHTRTNGNNPFTVNAPVSSWGEVLAWNWTSNMLKGIEQWYDEKEDWVNETENAVTGHYTQMIDPTHTYVGLATFLSNIGPYYNTTAGEYSYKSSLDETVGDPIASCIQKLEVKNDYIKSLEISGENTLFVGESLTLDVCAKVTINSRNYELIVLDPIWSSSDETVATVSNGKVTAKKAGTATITVALSSGISAAYDVIVEKAGPTAPVIIKQPSDVTVNAGETTAMTVEAEGDDLTYQWQKSNDSGETWSNCTSAEATMASFPFKTTAYMNGRQFRCIVTNSAGTVTSEAAVLTVIDVPIITKEPSDVTGSVGDAASVSVTATGKNLNYRWQKSYDSGKTWSDCTSASAAKATFSFTLASNMNGRMYRCVVSNENGTTTSKAVKVTVTETAPKITKQPESTSAAVGEQVSMKVTAEGSSLKYQWQRSSDNGKTWVNCTSAGSTTATFTFTMAKNFDGRKFRCKVSNNQGSVTSSAATVTLKGAGPVITKQPESTSAAEGEQVILNVTAEGNSLTYQWERSTDRGKTWVKCTSAGSTTSKFKFEMLKKFDGRMFRCKVSNSEGTTTSSTAIVTLKGEAPVITKQPESTTAAEGNLVSLNVTAEGSGLSYQWERSTDGGKTWVKCTSAGSTTATFSFTMAKNFDGRMFRCKVSNSAGSVTSQAVQVTLS